MLHNSCRRNRRRSTARAATPVLEFRLPGIICIVCGHRAIAFIPKHGGSRRRRRGCHSTAIIRAALSRAHRVGEGPRSLLRDVVSGANHHPVLPVAPEVMAITAPWA